MRLDPTTEVANTNSCQSSAAGWAAVVGEAGSNWQSKTTDPELSHGRSWSQRWSRMPIRFKLWLLMLPVQLLGLTIPAYWLWLDYADTKVRAYETRAREEAERLTRAEITKAREEYVRLNTPRVEDEIIPSEEPATANLGVSQNVSVVLRIDYRDRSVFNDEPGADAAQDQAPTSDKNESTNVPVASTTQNPDTTNIPNSDDDPQPRVADGTPPSESSLGSLESTFQIPVVSTTAVKPKGSGWNENFAWRQVREQRDRASEIPVAELRTFSRKSSHGSEESSDGDFRHKQHAAKDAQQLRILTEADVSDPGRVVITIMSVPLAPLRETLRRTALWMVVVVLTSIACLLPAIHFAVGIPVVGPVQELARRMRQAAPDTMADLRIPLTRHDEIGDLQQSFNVMATEIATKQAELLRQQETLELRVAERTAELGRRNADLSQANAALVEAQTALEAVNGELAKSNEELDAFAYTVAHDLQAPLRNVNFLVKEEIPSLVPSDGAEAHDLLKMASQLCEFNIKMVQELLSWARINREEPRIVPVDLNRTVEEVKVGLRAQLEERGASVQIMNPLPTVLCDRIPLHRVLTNLVTNGIKYNDRPDKRIEIGSQIVEGGGLAIYVRDNGIGIEPRNMPKLFTLLAQLHKAERFGKGIGMGLAIVKRTLEAYNGKIWAESTYGTGTTFWITLPLADS